MAAMAGSASEACEFGCGGNKIISSDGGTGLDRCARCCAVESSSETLFIHEFDGMGALAYGNTAVDGNGGDVKAGF